MVGRNDPCSCGSGKKYKRCCGSKGVDLVEMVVNEELDRVLTGYFDTYPKSEHKQEMNTFMRKWSARLSDSWEKDHIEEASSEFYLFIENNEMWRIYLSEQMEQMKRESVLAVLSGWEEPIMLLAEITRVEVDKIHVQELFGERTFQVTRNEGMPTDIGTLLFGVVLSDYRKGKTAVAPVSSMLFLARWSKQTKKSLIKLRAEDSEELGYEFVRKNALVIYELFINRSTSSMNELVEEVLTPEQLHALTELNLVLQRLEQPVESCEVMHKLSVAYFLNENPEILLDADFTSAAVKVGDVFGVLLKTDHTEEFIELNFEESHINTATHYEQLASLYTEMMNSDDELVAESIYTIGTDPRPTEKALWETSMTTGGVVQPERKPTVAGGRAQLLAFEAYRGNTEEARRQLAERAAELDSDNADVLLLQAEVGGDDAISLYEKAIQHASILFEPGENPWQNIPNRPFMRAAFAYGVHLFCSKDYEGASSLFIDLLKMNMVDNQGARYEAVASLIHCGRFEEAAQILIRYEKGSENDAVYHYLDWKLEYEGSNGESPNAEELLQVAIKTNSHVMHLKTFQVKPIPYPRFQEIKPGSEEEARYIWLLLCGGKSENVTK